MKHRMKFYLIIVLTSMLSHEGLTQTTMKLTSEGNLGIGTLNIPDKLTVQGKIRTQLNNNKFGSLYIQDNTNDDLFLNYGGAANSNEGIGFQINGSSIMNVYQNRVLIEKDLKLLNGSKIYVTNNNKFGSLHIQDSTNDDLFFNYGGAANSNEGIGFQINGSSIMNVYQNRVLIKKDLKLLNGSTIYVNGVAIADYVFSDEYDLLSIEDQGRFMAEYKHLPALLDANQIEADGSFDLSKRNEQAIEELEKAHLYIQELNIKIKDLDEYNKSLEERLKRLELLIKTNIEHAE